MDDLTTRFRVWLVPGTKPDWQGEAIILKADQLNTGAWTVLVRGNGSDFERFIKSRRDLFTLYERM